MNQQKHSSKEWVVITGGTGLVGRRLCSKLLDEGHQVIVLTRNSMPRPAKEGLIYAHWDPEKGYLDTEALAPATAIIHLAGEPVMKKRWSQTFKQTIVNSRVESGRLLVDFLKTQKHQVHSFITASAQGWYGPDRGGPAFKETDGAFDDFLGSTCKAWEATTAPVASMGIRWLALRTGIVLSNQGGALAEFTRSLGFRIATVMGTGKQMVSWIHIDDLAALCVFCLKNQAAHGPLNAVAPNPVTNRALVTHWAHQKIGHAFITLPVPALILQLALGERSIEVLKSCTLSAAKAQQLGFEFKYPVLENALHHLATQPGN